MLDIKLIRETPQIVKKNLQKRGDKEKLEWVDDVVELDKKWRSGLKKIEDLRRKRNVVTHEIAKIKANGKSASKEIQEMKDIPNKIKELEEKNQKYREKMMYYLMRIPNILHDSVPKGKDDEDNVETKKWGNPPKFDFKSKNHLDLLLDLGLIDQERANKISGNGFYYYKEGLVLLDRALQSYTIDFLRKKGYVLIKPPYMMRKKPYEGVTDFEFFQDQAYKIEEEDLYLIATSEHPMAAMFINEVLDKDKLPLKLVGISPCFRKEVGAHGKYTKGLFRMHQFDKIEQFIFCLPEQSWELHEELQKNAEELYQNLGLSYRVVNVCTGDIGDIAAKKYDIEIWMADGKYREVGSNSNCTDYQSRRLNIKYRETEGKPPVGFIHTLNNTAIATSRTMVAVLETYQKADGTIEIPKVLRPYMSGMKVLEKK
ncbi:MAG: serine--tRNA ligase [Candidatus Aenigmatarchaeota archaeon]